MKIILSFDEIPKITTSTALTIGTFDGVHFGHHALLSKLKKKSSHTTLLTFTNHPREVLNNTPAPEALSDPFVKFSLIEVHGIDTLISIPFTKELSNESYSDFLLKLLSKMPISHLLFGEGFTFGKNREGSEDKIREFGVKHGIEVDYIPKLELDGEIVSSRRIRSLISSGDLTQAERLLGRPYIIPIPHKKNRIDATHLCLPPDGTYRFYTEKGKPIKIQIETSTEGRWIQLPKPFLSPTLITSSLMHEFYK